MDFELSEDQQSILAAVDGLLARHAGAARAIDLAAKAAVDEVLARALEEAGFADVGLGDETSWLDAALVVEAVARAGGVVSAGASMLVAPWLTGGPLPGPVALVSAGADTPVRFGAHARTLLVLDGDEARRVPATPAAATPVRSNFGYPMGRLAADATRGGESLGAGSGPKLVTAWRLALAAEAVGSMRACMDVTLDYVARRRQFGRAIGSFQAVQHRLAECAVLLEGSRWLMLEAAHHAGSDSAVERTATAAAHAMASAQRIFSDTHQFSGSMGYTREHDLHVWSMRLQALRLELEGVAGHRRAVAQARWTP